MPSKTTNEFGFVPQPNAEEHSPEVKHNRLDSLVCTFVVGRGCLVTSDLSSRTSRSGCLEKPLGRARETGVRTRTGKHSGSANETTGYGNRGFAWRIVVPAHCAVRGRSGRWMVPV